MATPATKHPQHALFEELGLTPDKYLRPEQAARVVSTGREFLRATCLESHVNEVIVLPDGLSKLGLDVSIPSYVTEIARSADSVLSFCEQLDARQGLQNYDAYLSRFPDGIETLLSRDKDGDRFEDLLQMYREAKAEHPDDKYYISELGGYGKRDHPLTNERTRCILDADVRDLAEKDLGLKLPIWERGNAFVGEAGTGSCVHVDKVLWSNTGKNWTGQKLFAVWRLGSDTTDVLDRYYKKIMFPPFSETEIHALQKAVKVCLLVPGDVFVFCGACAHMAVSVGNELNVSGYEALVNFHPESLGTFRESGTEAHLEAEQASRTAMYEWKEDAVERLIDAENDVQKGLLTPQQLEDAVKELRQDRECSQLFHEIGGGHATKKSRTD